MFRCHLGDSLPVVVPDLPNNHVVAADDCYLIFHARDSVDQELSQLHTPCVTHCRPGRVARESQANHYHLLASELFVAELELRLIAGTLSRNIRLLLSFVRLQFLDSGHDCSEDGLVDSHPPPVLCRVPCGAVLLKSLKHPSGDLFLLVLSCPPDLLCHLVT